MRVALTGASGFLGGHVRAALLARGSVPLALVSGHACENEVGGRIEDDPGALFAALGQPTHLIHLAWGGLPNYHDAYHLDVQLPIQARFLEGMVRAGVKRVMVAGTCLEYGEAYGPLAESMPAKPVTAYAQAKNRLSRALAELRNHHDFEFGWARFFYMWGAGQAPTSLYSLVNAALDREAKSFDMSRGEQLRDFLPVEEAADIFVRLALGKTEPGVVNVCSGEPVSVRRMVERWIALRGKNMRLNLGHYPYPDYEPLAFWGDARRCHGILEGK